MRVDDRLNLVLPLRVEDGEPELYAISRPVSKEVFEAHFRALSLTHAEIMGRDASYIPIGIRCASLIFRDVSASEAEKRGRKDNAGSFLAEVKRLTVILAPSANGWEAFPVPTAIERNFLSAEEWAEVESALVFFTAVYWLATARRRREAMESLASSLGWRTTSYEPMEFVASLPTPTQADHTIRIISSVPS